MCGRYTNTLGPEELGRQIGDRLGVRIRDSAGTRLYNIAPTEQVLTIVASREQQSEAKMLRWGLLPGGKSKTRYPLINARLETLLEQGSYGGVRPDGSHRALVLADGYYEFVRGEDRKVKPQPFRFTVDGGRPFAFAGLWRDGEIPSCTILTCDSVSNETVARIHNRMPVILAEGELLKAWLDPAITDREAIMLCEPFRAERTTVVAANPALNKAGVEGPELLVAPAPWDAAGTTEQLSLG